LWPFLSTRWPLITMRWEYCLRSLSVSSGHFFLRWPKSLWILCPYFPPCLRAPCVFANRCVLIFSCYASSSAK
jgi:hypothetical protein